MNSHDAILGTEIIEFSENMILLLLFINLSAAVGNQSIFFDMRGSFFLLKLGKTSSGEVGEDRLKKFLGKSDVGWSNT